MFNINGHEGETNIKFSNCGPENQFAAIDLSEKLMFENWMNAQPGSREKDDFYNAWLNDDAAVDAYKYTPTYKNSFGPTITQASL